MTVGVFFLSRVAPKRDDLGTSIVHRQRGSWGGKMPSDEALEFGSADFEVRFAMAMGMLPEQP